MNYEQLADRHPPSLQPQSYSRGNPGKSHRFDLRAAYAWPGARPNRSRSVSDQRRSRQVAGEWRLAPRRGLIDHQTLSFDAINKFIEDDFLDGQRLAPTNDGRPDPRPDVSAEGATCTPGSAPRSARSPPESDCYAPP